MLGDIGYAETPMLGSAVFRTVVFEISAFADESFACN